MEENLKMHVEFSVTVNLGNNNFAKLGAMVEHGISDVEEFAPTFDFLYDKMRKKIYQTLAPFTINNSKKVLSTNFQEESENNAEQT